MAIPLYQIHNAVGVYDANGKQVGELIRAIHGGRIQAVACMLVTGIKPHVGPLFTQSGKAINA